MLTVLLLLPPGLLSPPPAVAALPVVDMTAVVLASQVEGLRGNQVGLGDDASTRLVQQALTAAGFPVASDGVFGRRTTAAYAKFQRSIGMTSIDANGIPGRGSLTRLGAGRFSIERPISIGSRSARSGTKRVNTRTARMVAAADRRVPWALTVTQGSYCRFGGARCAKASGGTHDGGGAIDVRVRGLTTTQRWQTVRALRTVGFAAWLRTAGQCGGCWPDHIHAIAIGDLDLWQKNGKSTNRDQVADYYVGRDGLSGHRADNTPPAYRVPFTTWEQYAGS